jgi:hypothetical protein
MKVAPELLLLGERLGPPKYSVMNSMITRRTISPTEKSLHVKCSPSVVTASADEGTIEMSRGRACCKFPFLAHQLSVFFVPARYRVARIVHSSSKVVLQTIKHTVIYPSLGPSLEVIALYPVVWYRR